VRAELASTGAGGGAASKLFFEKILVLLDIVSQV
jgi:hypothetical protein